MKRNYGQNVKPRVKPKKVYDNQCTYEYIRLAPGEPKSTRCEKLTGVNRFFCPTHFKLVE